MANVLRIGIVGCGKIARGSHAPGFAAVPGARITALCDLDKSRMAAIRDEQTPDALCFDNYNRMLEEAPMDAVSICTSNRFHAPMAQAALKRGLHVLCEKPMAGTLPDATRMIAAARKADRILQINQSLRYHALYQTVVNLVRQGRIGDPRHLRCLRAAGTTPDKRWSPGATWFVQKSEQGGLVLDIGIHMADLLAWIAGPVTSVAALVDTRTPGIDVPDHVGALFRFASGASGVLELSWSLPVGGNLLEIYGSEGRLRVGFDAKHAAGGAGIELSRKSIKGTHISYPRLKRGTKSSYACFAAAVKGRMSSPTPGELGREALAICDAIVKSGSQHRFVKVKSFKDERE